MLLFERMGVGLGVAVMHVTHFVDAARVEQNALRQRGFPRVDMRHDANIT
jgi:hypothetical protein